MSARRPPPAWRLPQGVNAPLWEYANTPRLAAEEDAYFADNPLFEADAEALDSRCEPEVLDRAHHGVEPGVGDGVTAEDVRSATGGVVADHDTEPGFADPLYGDA